MEQKTPFTKLFDIYHNLSLEEFRKNLMLDKMDEGYNKVLNSFKTDREIRIIDTINQLAPDFLNISQVDSININTIYNVAFEMASKLALVEVSWKDISNKQHEFNKEYYHGIFKNDILVSSILHFRVQNCYTKPREFLTLFNLLDKVNTDYATSNITPLLKISYRPLSEDEDEWNEIPSFAAWLFNIHKEGYKNQYLIDTLYPTLTLAMILKSRCCPFTANPKTAYSYKKNIGFYNILNDKDLPTFSPEEYYAFERIFNINLLHIIFENFTSYNCIVDIDTIKSNIHNYLLMPNIHTRANYIQTLLRLDCSSVLSYKKEKSVYKYTKIRSRRRTNEKYPEHLDETASTVNTTCNQQYLINLNEIMVCEISNRLFTLCQGIFAIMLDYFYESDYESIIKDLDKLISLEKFMKLSVSTCYETNKIYHELAKWAYEPFRYISKENGLLGKHKPYHLYNMSDICIAYNDECESPYRNLFMLRYYGNLSDCNSYFVNNSKRGLKKLKTDNSTIGDESSDDIDDEW